MRPASTSRVFIVTAEYDNPYLDVYGAELAHRLGELHKRAPRFRRMTRHNHISLVAHFHSDEEILGLEILEFIECGSKLRHCASMPAALTANAQRSTSRL